MLVAKKPKKANTKNNRKSRKNTRNKGNNRNRNPKNKKVKTKLNILIYSLSMVLICILLLSRYAHTTAIQMKISEKNKEIEALNEKKSQLSLELEEIKESGLIEKQAKVRMNMRRANEEQVIYLDVE